MSTLSPTHFLKGFHLLQVLLAGYGAYNSYIAIKNLREYEDSVRRAAKWSNEAQTQLDRTRYTQGAGVISIVLSIGTSLTLAIVPSQLSSTARTLASPILLVGLVAARQYIKSYWGSHGGTAIPLPMMGDYNEAQQKTKAILDVLEWLEYSWIATTFGWIMLRF